MSIWILKIRQNRETQLDFEIMDHRRLSKALYSGQKHQLHHIYRNTGACFYPIKFGTLIAGGIKCDYYEYCLIFKDIIPFLTIIKEES